MTTPPENTNHTAKLGANDAVNYLVKEMDLDGCSRRNYARHLRGRRYKIILLAETELPQPTRRALAVVHDLQPLGGWDVATMREVAAAFLAEAKKKEAANG